MICSCDVLSSFRFGSVWIVSRSCFCMLFTCASHGFLLLNFIKDPKQPANGIIGKVPIKINVTPCLPLFFGTTMKLVDVSICYSLCLFPSPFLCFVRTVFSLNFVLLGILCCRKHRTTSTPCASHSLYI